MRLYHVFVWFALLSVGGCFASCSTKEEVVTPDKPLPSDNSFYHGVDLSYVNQVMDHGGVYKENGEVSTPYHFLVKKGANLVRLRLWHNPDWVKSIYGDSTPLYSGLEDVMKSISLAKREGAAVLLDIHYSDTWADPSHQSPPKAWENIDNITVLKDSVYNYTYSLLKKMALQNHLPEFVQIGNEINGGILSTDTKANFPKLSVYDDHWDNQGQVINEGIRAVRHINREFGGDSKVVLHVADPKNLSWWFDNISGKGGVTDYDVAGFSYYYIWHKQIAFAQLEDHIRDFKNSIGKEVMLLETSYPFTIADADNYPNSFGSQEPLEGYPFTLDGQKQYMIDLTQMMMDAGASGVIIWEPAWISSHMKDFWGTSSSWDNCTFFDFDGEMTKVVDYLHYPYK
ncbi:arabinogalactan endo-1,4-beta-galactosidase [Halosquirtibacter laminarini]|uniref:Arabinogalactan endo-1,4-beta-galactosidase n=1 Tax=Halosquirtibacter laminarini TaxID=3374600 RepID=A0AC61NMD0_9BACT|nr:arabinogalactan endo-1,4-beta-galactosidase [Prolixibacteraceae bacterium]